MVVGTSNSLQIDGHFVGRPVEQDIKLTNLTKSNPAMKLNLSTLSRR